MERGGDGNEGVDGGTGGGGLGVELRGRLGHAGDMHPVKIVFWS